MHERNVVCHLVHVSALDEREPVDSALLLYAKGVERTCPEWGRRRERFECRHAVEQSRSRTQETLVKVCEQRSVDSLERVFCGGCNVVGV